MRPFRFAVSTRGSASREAWRGLARRIEELGYSTLLVPDHIGTPLAPIASIMAAAEATTTLRLGCHVFGNDFRNPVMLAKEVATLDLLSDGRFELGLGTGWLRDDYVRTGIPFDAPGVRVDRLVEAVAVIKGCLGEGPFSFNGRYYHVAELNLQPKPVQQPHPPLVIGGGSPRVLGLAAREADTVAINFRTTAEGRGDFSDVSAAATDRKLEWIRSAAGDRFADLELGVFAFLVRVTDQGPRRVVEEALTMVPAADRPSVDAVIDAPAVIVGSVDQIVETLLERRKRFGISYIVVRDPDPAAAGSQSEQFAAVVDRLAGQ